MPERFEKEFKILLTIAGSVVYVIGVNFFLTPLNLYSGGLIGVSQLIRTLIVKATGWDVNIDLAGIVFYVINVPIFILGFKQLAKPIVFLSSDCAAYISGVEIEIAGGKYAVQNSRYAWEHLKDLL